MAKANNVNWKTHEIHPDATIPVGKYKGLTIRELREDVEDEKYYEWMVSSGVIEQWGLLREKKREEPRRARYMDDEGNIWIGLREVNTTNHN